MTEEESQATIRACSAFMNQELPSLYIQTIPDSVQDPEAEDATDTNHHQSLMVPAHVLSPRYPLMTHLGVWLLQEDLKRAIGLVHLMEQQPNLDGLWKDEAYLHLWQHLLRQGQLFLDGNNDHTAAYIQKRELLYNGIVNGMGAYGRGSMMDFYQTLAQKVWDQPQATSEEKIYVLVACQHTLLRLMFKCRGVGTGTIVLFLKQTSWPIAVQETSGGVSLASSNTATDLEKWATEFLSQRNPIPKSVVSNDGDGAIDLSRLVEEDVLLQQQQQQQAAVAVPPGKRMEETDDAPQDKALRVAAMPHRQEAFQTSSQTVETTDASEEDQATEPQAPQEEFAARTAQQASDEDGEEEGYEVYHHPFKQSEQGDEEEMIDIDNNNDDDDAGEQPEWRAAPAPAYAESSEDGDDDDDDDYDDLEVGGPAGPSLQAAEYVGSSDDDVLTSGGPGRSAAAAANQEDSSDETAEIEGSDHGHGIQNELPSLWSGQLKRNDENLGAYWSDNSDEEPGADPMRRSRPGVDDRRMHSEDEEDHVHDSFSEDEEDGDEDSSSDGGGAVVIHDSENEESPVRPPRRFPENVRRDDDSDQYEKGDSDSDAQNREDFGDNSLHHFGRGRNHGPSSDDSAGAQVQDDDDDSYRGEYRDDAQRGRDQELGGDERAPMRAPFAAQEPIEIIDDEEEEPTPTSQTVASTQGEVRTPKKTARREELEKVTDQKEAAEWMGSMFQPAGDNSAGGKGSSLEGASPEHEHMETYPRSSSREGEKLDEKSSKLATAEASAGHEAQQPMAENMEHSPTKTDRGPGDGSEDAKVAINVASASWEKLESAIEEHSDIEQPQPDDEDRKSTEGQASQVDNVDSDATDDEEERVMEIEKAETAAVGGEFGDTTEEENDAVTSSRANMLADADRRADVLQARIGYASQLEEGYEPEDTHGYTEEEVSEAIHTEDEEEERRAAQESQKIEVSQARRPEEVEHVQHSVPHSSDDMDAAGEDTEHEEDLGAESSELEETAEVRDYPYSPSSEHERDPTTLLEFAQSAQHRHRYGPRPGADKATIVLQASQEKEVVAASDPHGDKSVGDAKSSEAKDSEESKVDVSNTMEQPLESQSVDEANDVDSVYHEETSDNFASVEDEKEADSTMATESLEMTEDTVDQVDSGEPGPEHRRKSLHMKGVHDAETDIEDTGNIHGESSDVRGDQQTAEHLAATEMVTDAHVEASATAMMTDEVGLAAIPENSMETESPAQEMEIANDSGNEMEVEDAGRMEDEAMADGDVPLKDEIMEPAGEPMESEPIVNENAAAAVEVKDIAAENLSPEAMREERVEDKAASGGALLDPATSQAADAAMDTQPVSISGGTARSSARHDPGQHIAATEKEHEDINKDEKETEKDPKEPAPNMAEEDSEDVPPPAEDDNDGIATRRGVRLKEQLQPAPSIKKTRSNSKNSAETNESDSDDSIPLSQALKKSASHEEEEGKDDASGARDEVSEDQSFDEEKAENDDDNDSVAISEMVKSRRSGKTTSSQSQSSAQPKGVATRRSKRQKAAVESPAPSENEEKSTELETGRSTRRSTRSKAGQGDEADDASAASSRPTRRSTRSKAQKSESSPTTSRATRATKTKKTDDDEGSVVSVASRTRSRGKKSTDDEVSVASTPSRRSTRSRKSTKKADDDNDDDDDKEKNAKKPATRSKKGLPPRAPTTRSSARLRKK